jgi:hypothetical protein
VNYEAVRWPNGCAPFYLKVRQNAERIRTGTVLAIDPSSGGSSLPGFAVFRAGELLTSGEISFPKKQDVYTRIQRLYDEIRKLAEPDVLAIEEIRGANFSHQYLRWSVGVSIAAGRAPVTVEVPIVAWKAVAKADEQYFKGNAQDSEKIGEAIILLAQKFREESDHAAS